MDDLFTTWKKRNSSSAFGSAGPIVAEYSASVNSGLAGIFIEVSVQTVANGGKHPRYWDESTLPIVS
jgi:hypothetical protein